MEPQYSQGLHCMFWVYTTEWKYLESLQEGTSANKCAPVNVSFSSCLNRFIMYCASPASIFLFCFHFPDNLIHFQILVCELFGLGFPWWIGDNMCKHFPAMKIAMQLFLKKQISFIMWQDSHGRHLKGKPMGAEMHVTKYNTCFRRRRYF